MHGPIKQAWVGALRSGEFKQGKNALKTEEEDGTVSFCCLGVLCELAVEAGVIPPAVDRYHTWVYGPVEDYVWSLLPEAVANWARLTGPSNKDPYISDRKHATLSRMNDAGVSFELIAGVIEREL